MNNNFKYSCIGDNSPENREHLGKLGYKRVGAIRGKKYIVTDDGYYYGTMVVVGYPLIYCINNLQLFQAVTAMRDDSDKDQWFKNIFKGGVWYNERHKCVGPVCYAKMSLAELQEHFK